MLGGLCSASSMANAATYQSLLNHLAGNTWNSPNSGFQIELLNDDPVAGPSEYNTPGNAPAGAFGPGIGGEFRVQRAGTSNNPVGHSFTYSFGPDGLKPGGPDFVFKTFCLEHGQSVTLGQPYYASIEPYAASGNRIFQIGDGTSTPPTFDLLSGQVKLLYGLYFERSDQLAADVAGFEFDDATWMSALQETIWHFEDAAPDGTPVSLTELSSQAQALANFANQTYGGGYTYFDDKVAALNLWAGLNSDGTPNLASDHQSQLIYTGLPLGPVPLVNPEPGSVLIWAGLATGAFVAWRRARRRGRTSSA